MAVLVDLGAAQFEYYCQSRLRSLSSKSSRELRNDEGSKGDERPCTDLLEPDRADKCDE